jgi:hypothetical protein
MAAAEEDQGIQDGISQEADGSETVRGVENCPAIGMGS